MHNPFTGNTVIEVHNVRLRPANSKHYNRDGSTTQFTIAKTVRETNIVNIADIGVAVISNPTGQTLNATEM